MKPSNPISTMDVYASTSQYIDGPTAEQQAAGTVPLDTLPADWWNWLWKEITTRINQASSGMESIYQELLSILSAASITPSDTSTTQVLSAIQALIRTIGTSTTAGTVKSSADSGKVAIDANGYMSPNGMGIPTNLNTTSKVIVSAVNEVLTALNAYKTSNDSAITGLTTSKAPTNHASTGTSYGTGTSTNYGHVKLSDSTSSDSGESSGVAATPAAVKAAYDLANGKPLLTNVAAAALAASASAGSSSTAARADHVHTFPSLVTYGGSRCKVDFTLSGTTLTITTTSV